MDIEEETTCNGIKRKTPYDQLNPTDSGDDDRTAELKAKSEKNLDGDGGGVDAQGNKTEVFKLMAKSDREIAASIERIMRSLQKIGVWLPDGGERFKENLRRHEYELQRRKKADNGIDETIQLSDHSDDGNGFVYVDVCFAWQKKYASKFAKFFGKKMEEEQEDSMPVCAFEKDSTYIRPCAGGKLKSLSQLSGKGRSRMGLSSSQLIKTSLVDGKEQMNSNDEIKDGDSTSFSEPKSPHDQPSRNLRPRSQNIQRENAQMDNSSSEPSVNEFEVLKHALGELQERMNQQQQALEQLQKGQEVMQQMMRELLS